MKRLLLLTLAAAVAMSLVAVMGVRSFGGPDVASAHKNTGTPHLELDVVEDGTGVWCNPVDTTTTVTPGIHKAALCATDLVATVNTFAFELNYDSALNTCTDGDKTSTALDANPDANVGATVFSGSSGAGNMGTVCDCSSSGSNPPVCDYWPGVPPSPPAWPATERTAFISCGCTGTQTTPFGAGISHPLAVVKYNAVGIGTENLSFGTVAVYGPGYVLRAATGATVYKEAAPPTPTATAVPAECDIGCASAGAVVVNPPALTMKVGDPPTQVDITETFKNFGAVSQGAPAATCNFAIATGRDFFVSNPPLLTVAVDPLKLGVRMEPDGSATPPYGDVCLYCNSANPVTLGKSIGDCLDPLKGATGPFDPNCYPSPQPSCNPTLWTYTVGPCDEGPWPVALPMSMRDNSCLDHADNAGSQASNCDWSSYSKTCVPVAPAPDVNCRDVQALGLIPLSRTVLAPNATATKTRQMEIECRDRGTFPVFVFAGNSQATDMYQGGSMLGATDPNAANNSCGAVMMVTCTKGPEMVKDCDTSTAGIQTNCNLWLMNPKFAGGVEAGTNPPVTLPKADANGCVLPDKGKGCLAVDVWLKSADDEDDPNDADLLKECLGAWEHQVRYDHKIIKFVDNLNPKTIDTTVPADGVADVSWLESTGRVANCSVNVLAENWILEGCVTTDGPAPGMQVGPCGEGIIEKMLIVPQTNDLIYRGVFRPTKDNGVVTNVVDDNCEITDIYAEPMADTLPGGLTPICGDMSITVRMLEGDVDLDCDVDVADEQGIAFRYGASWGLQLYDQWFDLEPKYADQDIDIKDLQFVFGRNYSNCQAPIPDDQSTPVDPGQP